VVYPGICHEGLNKLMKLVRLGSLWAKARIRDLPEYELTVN